MPIGVKSPHADRLQQRLQNPYSSTSGGSQNKHSPTLSNYTSNRMYSGGGSTQSFANGPPSLSIGISTANFWNGVGSNSSTPK
jgi:hypothetical protein